VTMRRRRVKDDETECFDAVFLATGPAHHNAIESDPLLRVLRQSGLIRPDRYGLGIEVDESGRAINAGRDNAIFVAGALARGTFGELIAVPDLVKHALRLTSEIWNQVESGERSASDGTDRLNVPIG